MKYLKIILIIVLLLVLCSVSSLGTGIIESGDKTICFEPEEPNTLNEWFYDLTLSEKIKIYNEWNE